MGFIVQQLRYIIFFVFIVLRFPKPMSCQMQKRITSKTAADFSLRKCGHCREEKKRMECLGLDGFGFARQRVGVSISGKYYPYLSP